MEEIDYHAYHLSLVLHEQVHAEIENAFCDRPPLEQRGPLPGAQRPGQWGRQGYEIGYPSQFRHSPCNMSNVQVKINRKTYIPTHHRELHRRRNGRYQRQTPCLQSIGRLASYEKFGEYSLRAFWSLERCCKCVKYGASGTQREFWYAPFTTSIMLSRCMSSWIAPSALRRNARHWLSPFIKSIVLRVAPRTAALATCPEPLKLEGRSPSITQLVDGVV